MYQTCTIYLYINVSKRWNNHSLNYVLGEAVMRGAILRLFARMKTLGNDCCNDKEQVVDACAHLRTPITDAKGKLLIMRRLPTTSPENTTNSRTTSTINFIHTSLFVNCIVSCLRWHHFHSM